jgi:hypothetical protein
VLFVCSDKDASWHKRYLLLHDEYLDILSRKWNFTTRGLTQGGTFYPNVISGGVPITLKNALELNNFAVQC